MDFLKFPLSTSELELLNSFALHPSANEVAKKLNRDVTVVTRMIQNIQTRYPLFRKKNNRWVLSDLGNSIAILTQSHLLALQKNLDEISYLRIATTPEFAARVVPELLHRFPIPMQFEVIVSEFGVESQLLSGKANLGFDCGRPYSPLIRFKRLLPETIALVTPAGWSKIPRSQVIERNCVEFTRLPLAACLKAPETLASPFLRTNSIALAREMVLKENCWSILPLYTIQNEIQEKTIFAEELDPGAQENFGLWWNDKNPLPKEIHLEFTKRMKAANLNG